MSCGLRGPSISGSPARTRSPSCTFTCTPRGSEYSRCSPPVSSGTMMILRWPLTMPPCLTTPSISRDDRRLARLARLEELDHARQTARDVLRLRGLARDLREHVARRTPSSPSLHHQVGVRRHVVLARMTLSCLVADLDRRLLLLVRRVDDDPPRQARDLVDFLVHGDAVDDVLVADRARFLGEDRERVRIPLEQRSGPARPSGRRAPCSFAP